MKHRHVTTHLELHDIDRRAQRLLLSPAIGDQRVLHRVGHDATPAQRGVAGRDQDGRHGRWRDGGGLLRDERRRRQQQQRSRYAAHARRKYRAEAGRDMKHAES